MPRSRREVIIPLDFHAHDGTGCPLEPDDKPSLILRMGTHIASGHNTAAHYSEVYADDPWTWDAKRPGPFDIIAYRSFWTVVPRLTIDAPEG